MGEVRDPEMLRHRVLVGVDGGVVDVSVNSGYYLRRSPAMFKASPILGSQLSAFRRSSTHCVDLSEALSGLRTGTW